MKKEDFEIGITFRTSTGEWLVTEMDDFKVMAKPLWRWAPLTKSEDKGFDKEYFPEDFTAIPFQKKHWPACTTIGDWRRSRSPKQGRNNRIPCYRCYNSDPLVPTTILEICSSETVDGEKISRGTTVLVCARCKKSDDRSCLHFGKYKWICQCGANIWWDDPKTDEKCISCSRDRTFWTPVQNE